ncbi:MAG: DSD1 family PLP-dependent enzyme [Gemmatales bacterium]|nr:DSD1 family PLP-dependent enzyme [Gemmatales bacterium]MDW8385721.1 DSD1 family PLP-dependent enzyme [Gemmatales bacterium]
MKEPRLLDDIPTPALILDLEAFRENLRRLAEHCQKHQVSFRPHAKSHKCPEIARRQIESGAIGISVATVDEAEAMANAGLRGLLLTSPIVEAGKIERLVRLIQRGADLMLAIGHVREVELLAERSDRLGVVVPVLLDLDVGDRRTGVLPGTSAVELARRIAEHRSLRLQGLQAYAGHASHVVGFEARKAASWKALSQALETRDLVVRAGFEMPILSVGSTGTYNIDSEISGVTELQCGSYVFMDLDYRRIGGAKSHRFEDFHFSLTVLTTVVSAEHPDRVTVDAGIKAFATDAPWKPEAADRPGLVLTWVGDEFGIVTASDGGKLPRLGDRLRFLVPHCDPTVNLYDRIHVVQGETVVDVWKTTARRRAEAG